MAHASAPHLVYFETQEGALCGKHVLNNLKEGPYVTCEACGLAARQVVQHLSQVLGEQPFALFAPLTPRPPWLRHSFLLAFRRKCWYELHPLRLVLTARDALSNSVGLLTDLTAGVSRRRHFCRSAQL